MIGRKDSNGPAGQGIAEERSFCLNTTDKHAVMHIVYDTTQVTSPENESNPQPEDPCHPLVKNGHDPLLVEVEPRSFAPAHYTRGFGQCGTAGTAGTLKKEYNDSSTHIIQPLGEGNDRVSDTLTANKSMTTSTYGDIALHNNVLVRRLTPLECGRLQGFPDGYLEDVPGYSDSKAYAAFGNSMTTNVMQWIGSRIKMVDDILTPPPNPCPKEPSKQNRRQ